MLRYFSLLLLATLVGEACSPKRANTVTYRELKEYEGTYEYARATGVQLVVSPKDTVLVAIIQESKYPLRYLRKDVFLNASGKEVHFLRTRGQAVTGFKEPANDADHVFKRLSQTTTIAPASWYPRPPTPGVPFRYRYVQPEDLHDGLPVGTLEGTGLDPALLARMVAGIVDETYPNIHSILIVKDGKLVLEEYFYGYDASQPHQLRSATKSFISALMGIAIDRKMIPGTDAPVLSYFPEYALEHPAEAKKQITIGHLLTNQSGLACDDNDPQSAGNENNMVQSEDWVKFTLSLPLAGPPGGPAKYCSGGVITLGRIVEKASGRGLHDFARQHLFAPLNIRSSRWEFKPDPSQAESFCQLYLAPRDMAKFGLLYLQRGKWAGQQLISPQWVDASLAAHTTLNRTEYGYLWWRQWLKAAGTRYDGVAAKGNGGQRIYLWPSLNMVTVITGGNFNTQSPADKLLIKHVLPAFNTTRDSLQTPPAGMAGG
jgi:CubicO group peptidase (beta-lactamase class C family)